MISPLSSFSDQAVGALANMPTQHKIKLLNIVLNQTPQSNLKINIINRITTLEATLEKEKLEIELLNTSHSQANSQKI